MREAKELEWEHINKLVLNDYYQIFVNAQKYTQLNIKKGSRGRQRYKLLDIASHVIDDYNGNLLDYGTTHPMTFCERHKDMLNNFNYSIANTVSPIRLQTLEYDKDVPKLIFITDGSHRLLTATVYHIMGKMSYQPLRCEGNW